MRIASPRRTIAVALGLLAACAASAAARPRWERRTGGSLNLDAGYERMGDELQRETIGIGLRAGISPRETILLVVGLDLGFGLAQPVGFSHEATLYPLGVGVVLGSVGRLTVVGGVGVSGVTGTLAVAGQLPLEARLDLRLGSRLRLELAAAVAEHFGNTSREDGAEHAPFGDTLKLQANLRLGKSYPRHGFRSSNGYYLGAVYRELAGLHSWGVVVGHSLDFAR